MPGKSGSFVFAVMRSRAMRFSRSSSLTLRASRAGVNSLLRSAPSVRGSAFAMSKYRCSTNACGCASDGEIVEECLHFVGGVGVAGALRDFDSGPQARDGFFIAAQFRQRLRGHLVGGHVVWIVLDECAELGECLIGAAFGDVRHGEAIACEGVGGVLLKYLREKRDSVHIFRCSAFGGRLASWARQLPRFRLVGMSDLVIQRTVAESQSERSEIIFPAD